MPNVSLSLGPQSYEVHVANGALESIGYLCSSVRLDGKAAIISDSNVAPLYAERVRLSLEESGFTTTVHIFTAGEAQKNLSTIETLAKAVTGLFHPGHEIKVIGIRHGEKMYETLLTNEECAGAIDMGDFYRVPCDNRGLNYDKFFKDGDVERNPLTEFNSGNTELLNVEQVKEKLLSLQYIRDELKSMKEQV